MTFEQLRTFLVVAEERNFTRAAEVLYLSQPAVSQHVLALERGLKVSLFDRKGRILTLTVAGQRLLAYARMVLSETEALVAELQSLDDPLQGLVTVGSINSVGVYVLPTLIAALHRRHPSVRVELKTGSTEQISDDLQRGGLDLAILDLELASSASRRFRSTPYGGEELTLILPPGHGWAGRTDVSVEELLGQEMIMRERRSRSRAILEGELANRDLDVSALRVVLDLGSTEAIKQAVCSGLGIGFVPACSVQQELKWGTLSSACLMEGNIHRQLWVYSPIRNNLPRRVQVIREFLLGPKVPS